MKFEFEGGSLELDHDGVGDNPYEWSSETECFVTEIDLDCGLSISRRDPCHLPILHMHRVQYPVLDAFFWDHTL